MTRYGPRILHLFANYKWTGPAAPAIRTAARLRGAGADVVFAQAAWTAPDSEHRMAKELWAARMPVIGDLDLCKHFRPLSLLRDMRRLRRRLLRRDFEILHTHLPGDHLVAALACRGARPRPVLVRSLYDPEAPRRSARAALAFRQTAGVVAPTPAVGEQVCRRFGFTAGQVLVQDPPVEPAAADGDLRRSWGLSAEHRAVGITARIQPHRRFDLLWQVVRQVVDRCPDTRFVLLGRGDEPDVEALVRAPIRELGLEEHVILPGYLQEPLYGRALASLDLFLFLVPGSDGTCRAVREAMARGLPVVATRRGMLPGLLAPEPTVAGAGAGGICCDETSDAIAAAVVDLVQNDDRRRSLGAGALLRAGTSMDPVAATERLLAFYDRLRGQVG